MPEIVSREEKHLSIKVELDDNPVPLAPFKITVKVNEPFHKIIDSMRVKGKDYTIKTSLETRDPENGNAIRITSVRTPVKNILKRSLQSPRTLFIFTKMVKENGEYSLHVANVSDCESVLVSLRADYKVIMKIYEITKHVTIGSVFMEKVQP